MNLFGPRSGEVAPRSDGNGTGRGKGALGGGMGYGRGVSRGDSLRRSRGDGKSVGGVSGDGSGSGYVASSTRATCLAIGADLHNYLAAYRLGVLR